jgi:hypothetical protein
VIGPAALLAAALLAQAAAPAPPPAALPAPPTADPGLQASGPAAPEPGAPPTADPGLQASGPAAPEPGAPPEAPAPLWSVPIAHTAGLLAGMRLSLSVLWPEPFSPRPLSRSAASFRRAYSERPHYNPRRSFLESDGDPWVINVVGHGLFGAEVYARARQCGAGPWASLAFTVATSTLWEYGIESFHKQPSAVDLVLTPVLGVALGEGRVQMQRWLRRRPRTGWVRFWELFVDPIGEAERGWLKTRC